MSHSKTPLREPPCSDELLSILLDGDEDSHIFREAAGHVETCSRCQSRLFELSASSEHWAEQREMLQPIEGDAPETGFFARKRLAAAPPVPRASLDEAAVRELLAPPSHPELLGRLGRYDIERVIGAGGMGIVLKGFDGELHRPVAIKLLAPHLARVGAARKRFAREARAAAAVVHEHVVPIHNVESEHAPPFLVMQFIPGESLQARVEREGPLSPAEVLRIGRQAAAGLAAAHAQGLVHRDVKPANILLENGVERAYLTDFGLARASDDASLTYTGIVAGTPHYMSPEQANGHPLDPRSDLFSLGSVLYFMAIGHPPFRADGPMAVLKRTCHDRHRPARQANAGVPESLSTIIDRLLEKKPSARFASAGDLEIELATALSDLQQGRTRSRQRLASAATLWFALAAVASLAVLSIATLAMWRPATLHRETPAPPAKLRDVDPSPMLDAQEEFDSLFEMLDDLEATPFPESQR